MKTAIVPPICRQHLDTNRKIRCISLIEKNARTDKSTEQNHTFLASLVSVSLTGQGSSRQVTRSTC